MEAQLSYIVSRSLLLAPTRSETLMVSNSLSRAGVQLDLAAVAILLAFSRSSTVLEAHARLADTLDVEPEIFDEVVSKFIAHGLITPTDQGGAAPTDLAAGRFGFASLVPHHAMLRDTARVLSYKAAILRHAAGKTVAEIGCGTGILSLFALQGGARQLYAIEETQLAELADQIFRANGYTDRVQVLRGNSRNIELPERVDVIVHEILGTDPLSENLLPVIRDARDRMLAPHGRMIPHRLIIGCVGVAAPTRPYLTKERAIREVRDLERLYGVSLEPFRADLGRSNEFRCPLGPGANGDQDTVYLTEECVLFDVDLMTNDETQPGVRASCEVTRDGVLGGVLLYFRAKLDETSEISNSPFLPRTHWALKTIGFADPLPVKAGQRVELEARIADRMIGHAIEVAPVGRT